MLTGTKAWVIQSVRGTAEPPLQHSRSFDLFHFFRIASDPGCSSPEATVNANLTDDQTVRVADPADDIWPLIC